MRESEVCGHFLLVTYFNVTLGPGLIMLQTSEDSFFARAKTKWTAGGVGGGVDDLNRLQITLLLKLDFNFLCNPR